MTDTISNKRTPPFSMRLSDDERTEIERRASIAGLSIAGYCKSVILNKPPPRKSRRASIDQIELSRLLGELGRVGSNLNQIARQLNMGASVEVPEVQEALNDLAETRAAIMTALGYTDNDPDSHKVLH